MGSGAGRQSGQGRVTTCRENRDRMSQRQGPGMGVGRSVDRGSESTVVPRPPAPHPAQGRRRSVGVRVRSCTDLSQSWL